VGGGGQEPLEAADPDKKIGRLRRCIRSKKALRRVIEGTCCIKSELVLARDLVSDCRARGGGGGGGGRRKKASRGGK
jgi:hypothetical protein